jgi:hypothetical protein
MARFLILYRISWGGPASITVQSDESLLSVLDIGANSLQGAVETYFAPLQDEQKFFQIAWKFCQTVKYIYRYINQQTDRIYYQNVTTWMNIPDSVMALK